MDTPHSQKSNQDGRSPSAIHTLAQERPSESNAIQIPRISLPKGGGALKGIDEKFEVNPSNGTASFSIPLPFSPNRNGFTPTVLISYNSGAGNSILGIGWSLNFPAIQRKTDKQLPRYLDYTDEEDTFMFSGVEDLVPKLNYQLHQNGDGEWKKVEHTTNQGYLIHEYRPRIEGAFSRIERIRDPQGEVYWRVTSTENRTTIFGRHREWRIADPRNENRIFQWLPQMSFDDKGSVILYEYKAENAAGLNEEVYDQNRFFQENEETKLRFANRYLKRVRYGNSKAIYPYQHAVSPFDPSIPPDAVEWHFELVLDYGEHDTDTPEENLEWPLRIDPYSSYRAGFEIRTCRLLKRALLFHTFPALNNGRPTLIRSLDFKHPNPERETANRETELEFLTSITQRGYILDENNTYASKALPSMDFEYQLLQWDHEIHKLEQEELVHSPVGASGNYQWVDLYSEGISGILSEQGGNWYYKHNLGDAKQAGRVDFEPAQLLMSRPSFSGLTEGTLSLRDIEANGQKQIVVNQGELEGYFELHSDGSWAPFRTFPQPANIDLSDPNVRLFDINGDGIPEIVMTEEDAFLWFPNRGKEGYEKPIRQFKPFDEERGPALVFAESEQSIFLADMSGDGLIDIVRIRNGEVCYWPNLGYCRFGRKVTMGNAPVFDTPDLFNPAYLQLADISGTGTTDIIYLGKNQFQAFLNLSGNRWGKPEHIDPFFPTEQPNRISVTDLLGNGTGCLVWSTALPGYREAPMRYIDLMGGRKPHIMTRYLNNFGKVVSLEYKSSTWFYLQDKLAGNPWITRLPFPVQCVRKTTIEDKVTGLIFCNTYDYHHGYYDPTEREFRGFGRVDQRDTETFGTLKKQGAANAEEKILHQPPVLSKTWFHTGAFINRRQILDQFKQEYWYNGPDLADSNIQISEAELPAAQVKIGKNITHDPTIQDQLLARLSVEEWREALRACKGMVLRQEVFAEDGSPEEKLPYSAATHNCEIQMLQGKGANPHAVFTVQESESITYQYERNYEDPRVAHTLHLETDEYGNVLSSASVVYLRHREEPDFADERAGDNSNLLACLREAQAAQHQTHIVYSENQFTNDVKGDLADDDYDPAYRLRVIRDTSTYELFPPGNAGQWVGGQLQLYRITDFSDPLKNQKKYHEKVARDGDCRLIERVKNLFLPDDLTDTPLPDEVLGKRGLLYESYQLAYTDDLLADIFRSTTEDNTAPIRVGADDMSEARFHVMEGKWWIRSGRMEYEPEPLAESHFLLPIAYRDPLESKTEVIYDDTYLYVRSVKDALDNRNEVQIFDYRTLSPVRMKDINDDISEVLLDELGLVKAMAIMGKGDEADDLSGLLPYATESEDVLRSEFWSLVEVDETDSDTLHAKAKALLQHAGARFIYDFDRAPAAVAAIVREEHHRTLVDENREHELKVQISLEYSGGMGQVVMQKTQAENGTAKRWSNGELTEVENGHLRWIGNGRTVFNNKGNPILQYEPYFSTSARFEDAPQLVEHGVFIKMTYDPLGRQIRTDFPDHTYGKVAFSPWWQEVYDQNDTAVERKADGEIDLANSTRWYRERIGYSGKEAKDIARKKAAQRVEVHAGTPPKTYLDTLGRPFLAREQNRWQTRKNGAVSTHEAYYYTRVELDIEGNARKIFDARFNQVMEYQYDLLGHRVFENSMDAGKRWLFNNVIGHPVKAWDQRRQLFSYTYDVLHRPTEMHIPGGENGLGHVYERISYGESLTDAKVRRLRGRPYLHYDTAGVVHFESYDFKGNLLESSRQLLSDPTSTPNWAANPGLEDETFVTRTRYDALNRPLALVAPHTDAMLPSVLRYGYNPAGLLEAVSVNVRETDFRTYVQNIDYNEKGQRTRIKYGNGIQTSYTYDTKTFRLKTLKTQDNGKAYQQLHYTYDPVGNITDIRDNAQQTIYFNNGVVEPHSEYAYDALYRLIAASGREHIGQNQRPSWNDHHRRNHAHPNDGKAMRRYVQCYEYDAVGNILAMLHKDGPDLKNYGTTLWKRYYNYEITNNRLVSTSHPGEDRAAAPYTTLETPSYQDRYPHHEHHGYITRLPHLQDMQWTFREELQKTVRQNGGDPTETWYVYDAGGQRTHKINARADGAKQNERLYLGGFELYREFSGDEVLLERESLHIMDGEQRIALIETKTKGTITTDSPDRVDEVLPRYQFSNHLGSAILEIGEQDGNLIELTYEEYHPYGSTAYHAKNGASRSAKKRYRYTGMERDEESGLNYHSARYYLPWLGRWLSGDPKGLVDGGNVYVYGKSNPIVLLDRNGGQTEQINFWEAPVYHTEITATYGSRGISPNLRLKVTGVYRIWTSDYTSKIDVGHIGRPHVLLRAGEITIVGPQLSSFNRSQGAAIERQMASEARVAGRFARVDGKDMTPEGIASKGRRYPRRPLSPALRSSRLEVIGNRTELPTRNRPRILASPPAGGSTLNQNPTMPEQLSFNFGGRSPANSGTISVQTTKGLFHRFTSIMQKSVRGAGTIGRGALSVSGAVLKSIIPGSEFLEFYDYAKFIGGGSATIGAGIMWQSAFAQAQAIASSALTSIVTAAKSGVITSAATVAAAAGAVVSFFYAIGRFFEEQGRFQETGEFTTIMKTSLKSLYGVEINTMQDLMDFREQNPQLFQ